MTDRPILFSGAMVLRLLDGSKTQTRRLVDLPELKRSTTPGYDWTWRGQAPIRTIAQQRKHPGGCWQDVCDDRLLALCPYYRAPGDRLWVRETWRAEERSTDCVDGIRFRADDAFMPIANTQLAADAWVEAYDNGEYGSDWRPSIFCKRWMSRITLPVISVRVERLQDISEADAIAEGVTMPTADAVGCENGVPHNVARRRYATLWDELNFERAPWSSNPWVWVVSWKTAEVRL